MGSIKAIKNNFMLFLLALISDIGLSFEMHSYFYKGYVVAKSFFYTKIEAIAILIAFASLAIVATYYFLKAFFRDF